MAAEGRPGLLVRLRPTRQLGRYGTLLATLVLLLATAPFVDDVGHVVPRFGLLTIFAVAAAIFGVSGRRWTLYTALVIGLPAMLLQALAEISGVPVTELMADVLSAIFFSYATVAMINSVMRETAVSADTILGGISIYLLFALVFTMIFDVVDTTWPGSFMLADEPVQRGADATYIYMSFVTLTTLGYGDVRPVGDVARMLCAGEAVLGQLFVAIFVARLVGLHIAGGRDEA